jgi:CheY-like chemotaxis protein
VEDTGIGMDERVKAHVFEPFFTTKAVGEGTGLGLAAVHGTMLSHSGGVAVESSANRGTCVRLYFPSAHGQRISLKPQSMTRELTRLSGTVLIVDDEPLMLRVSKRHLTQLGLDVVAVGDGASALALIAAGTPFDCVITDFVMPNMSGNALIQKIREINIEVPIIIMTGYPSGSTPERDGILSEHPCLRKPFSREELAKVLAQVLRSRRTNEALNA